MRDPRVLAGEYPAPVFFAAMALLTAAVTVAYASAALVVPSARMTVRLVALTAVLALFGLGFAVGPLAERYL